MERRWGRQIAVFMAEEDEEALLRFLREGAEIAILEGSAPTREGLWVERFVREHEWHHSYKVWNRAYPWTPSYVQYGPDPHNPEGNRDWYVDNTSAAPLLEVSRSRQPRGSPLLGARLLCAGRPRL